MQMTAAAAGTGLEANKEAEETGQRHRFAVELRAGETTIISWKRLLRESGKGGEATLAPPGDGSVVEGRVCSGGLCAEAEPKDAPPPNRFSAVIEKIERSHEGEQSSDEEGLDDIPDDDEYDTEDSFIDDAELDEYFLVNKSATKYSGYCVNKGKVELTGPSSSPNVVPKKRRRLDSTKSHSGKSVVHNAKEPVNMANMQIKAAAQGTLLGRKSSTPWKELAPYGEHRQEARYLKPVLGIPAVAYKKKYADPTKSELKAPSKDFPPQMDRKTIGNQNVKPIRNRDLAYKSKGKTETSAAFDPAPGVKAIPTQAEAQPKNLLNSERDIYPAQVDRKTIGNHNVKPILNRDLGSKSKGKCETSAAIDPAPGAEAVPSQAEAQSKNLLDGETDIEASSKIRCKEKNELGEFPEVSSSVSIRTTQKVYPSSIPMKEGAAIKPKGTTLERALHALEKIVATCRQTDLGVQETDASAQGGKRRLPHEVKQKLAKVARLSASQCKIREDDLIDRLMGILGHLVQRKTLKRNMKLMVELGLSAKQQKADRFQQIKKEVNEMIATRVSLLKSKVAEQQDGSADDFQEAPFKGEKRALTGKFRMDKALEDKICELYDLHVEGMDEDKGPQSRKLYVELAKLWPSGYMDNLGVKEAIYRSKDRKRAMYNRHKVRDEEKLKRKRLASAGRVNELNPTTQVGSGQEKPASDSSVQDQINASLDKQSTIQTIASFGRKADPFPIMNDFGSHLRSKHEDEVRGSLISVTDGGVNVVEMKKKKKKRRRVESDMGETHAHPPKHPLQDGKEKHNKNTSSHHKPTNPS